MSAVSEQAVERAFAQAAKLAGGWALKLVSPGNAGVPDRLALLPDGTVRLVELKAPGKHPRPLQARMFAKLERAGHPVTVIDSVAAARAFWEVRA